MSLDELRDTVDGDEPASLSIEAHDSDPVLETHLERMIASLPLDNQTAIDLVFRHDLAALDAGQTLGISGGGISRLLREGIDLLRADARAVGLPQS